MHPSHHRLHVTPIEIPLYVVCAIENPDGYAARYRHYHAFAKHIEDSGAILYTVEVVYGDQNFEVTTPGNPRHIQLRAKTQLWRKENLHNIGVAHLPHDWQNVALYDADFLNTRPDWVQATLQALSRYSAVQLFHTYSCLRFDHTVESVNNGFVFGLAGTDPEKKGYLYHGAPGGGWAYTRKAWDAIEGMLEAPILGSADRYMAHTLANVGRSAAAEDDKELERCAPAYIAAINEWRDRARAIAGNIWYVENHAIHYWHGPYKSRGYGWRWKILASHNFDPMTDLRREHTGLLELRGNKPVMRDEIRAYFRSRNEDATS